MAGYYLMPIFNIVNEILFALDVDISTLNEFFLRKFLPVVAGMFINSTRIFMNATQYCLHNKVLGAVARKEQHESNAQLYYVPRSRIHASFSYVLC